MSGLDDAGAPEAQEPLDTSALQRVGGPLGSTPAGLYEDAQGRRWYIKTLESPERARNEWVAAQLYRLAGAPTLQYRRTRDPRQIATAWQPLDQRRVARLSEAQRRQAQHWFGVHAWTANWDAAGFDGDNQGVRDGVVLTLDVGGALAFRAQGEPKGRAFSDRVDEFERLRRDPDNPQALRLFGDMAAADLNAAIEVVTRLSAGQIRRLIAREGGGPALADRMVARQADLAARRLAA